MPVRPSRPVHARGASWLLPLSGADRMPFFLRGETAAAGRRSSRGMTARSRSGGSREADGRDLAGVGFRAGVFAPTLVFQSSCGTSQVLLAPLRHPVQQRA